MNRTWKWSSFVFSGIMLSLLLVLSSAVPNLVSSAVRNKRWPMDCPIAGCKGQKGVRGSPGPLGPQGYAGVRGAPGYCDANFCLRFITQHLPRIPQNDPVVGPKGEQGATGDPGRKGMPGKPADPGLPGEKGMQGPPGQTGPPGESGRKGFPGEQGPPGRAGKPGENGEPGRKGMPGQPGTPGEDGIPGRTGPPGKDGRAGTPGKPGEVGKDGADGMKGDRGPPGPPIDVAPIGRNPCTLELQGVIRFDSTLNKLYFCNGSMWMCLKTDDCGGPITCESPLGPQPVGGQWYQVFVSNVTQGTQDAADVVLLVDESGSMINEQMWLLVMVPFLERVLTSAGVGDGDVHNRYCLIGFGAFPPLRSAHFRLVDGMPCYSAANFPRAQGQLITRGLMEDGFQAIQFALDRVPFRASPFIAKNILLITDEGRVPIPEGENLTRPIIEQQLKSRDILLNVIVSADYELADNTNASVLGVDSKGVSYILQDGGTFNTSTSPYQVTNPHNNTADAYVDLALEVGGASWALRILRESSINSNQDVINSFTSAFAQIKLREIRETIESCRRCTCVLLGQGGVRRDCVTATNTEFCRCVVQNGGDSSQCVQPEEPTRLIS